LPPRFSRRSIQGLPFESRLLGSERQI
jgi:hypothetical protein